LRLAFPGRFFLCSMETVMNERTQLQSEHEVKVQRVDFEGGKYSVCVEEGTGRVYLLRYGSMWAHNPLYGKMLAAIAYDKRLNREPVD